MATRKEPSHWDGSFEHPKHMFKLMDKKIITILRWNFLHNWPYVIVHILSFRIRVISMYLLGTCTCSIIYFSGTSFIDSVSEVCFILTSNVDTNEIYITWIYTVGKFIPLQLSHQTWVKVFSVFPEFRILRLLFHRKLASKCWIREIIIANLIYYWFT